jgi:hypothetical protein
MTIITKSDRAILNIDFSENEPYIDVVKKKQAMKSAKNTFYYYGNYYYFGGWYSDSQ